MSAASSTVSPAPRPDGRRFPPASLAAVAAAPPGRWRLTQDGREAGARPIRAALLTEGRTVATESTQPAGLYRKFTVQRTDGRDAPGGDREGAEYFVLDLTNDPFAKAAIAAYIEACASDGGYDELVADLSERYLDE